MNSLSPRSLVSIIIFSLLVIIACFYCFLLGRSGWPINMNQNNMVGYCKGHKIQASVVDYPQVGIEKKSTGLLIIMDDKKVYLELDKNSDGRPDDIIHFDNDRQAYATVYNATNRSYTRREVEYYSSDNKSRYMVYDSGSNGTAWKRVREDGNGNFIRESLANGAWVLEK